MPNLTWSCVCKLKGIRTVVLRILYQLALEQEDCLPQHTAEQYERPTHSSDLVLTRQMLMVSCLPSHEQFWTQISVCEAYYLEAEIRTMCTLHTDGGQDRDIQHR